MGMLDNVFDTSTLLADERARVATEAAGLTRGRGAVYLAAKGGERMTQGVRSMLGVEDPAVTKINDLKSILQKYESGINTAEQALSAASELRMGGYLDYATKMETFAVSLANAESNRLNALKSSTSSTDPNIAAARQLEIDAAKWLTKDSNESKYEHNLENWKRQLLELRKKGYFDTDTYKQLQKNIDDEEKNVQAEEKSVDSDVMKMGDRWVKNANIPQTEAALVRLENVLAKYPENTDIPGIDLWERHVTASLLGNVLNFPMGVEAAEVVSALAAVSNALLKERSGAAVTPHEFERFQEEIRGGAFPSDTAVRTFVAELRIALDSEKAQIAGAFRKEVRHRYWFQSGYYPTYDKPEDVPANLPSGSYYFSPDGILRRKK
tara:strand:- start:244 stop:1386 length:1143 start_codon:yes stop_codon:yes gene_type:complete